ncbi:MAG: deaminase [Patescibacteria group bacterium]
MDHWRWIESAAKLAREHSRCGRARCGSVIVLGDEVIGEGVNSPPGDIEGQSRCHRKDELKDGFKSDRTCCVHAEQRAVMDALKRRSEGLQGSMLYFVRLDENGEPKPSGQPYCTICSKMALDAGIAEFVLWHGKNELIAYDTLEYNDLSFAYPL